MLGRIVKVIPDKGYGFINANGECRDVFFHCSELRGLVFDESLADERIEFDNGLRNGREIAINIRPAEAK